MDSRRALKIIISIVVLVLIALAIFFFFRKTSQVPSNGAPENPFGTSTGTTIFPGNGSTGTSTNIPSASSTIVLSPADTQKISTCNSSISIERNDCIKKAAIQNKETSLCAAILGTFGQTDCKNSVTQVSQNPVDVFSKTITNYTFSFAATPSSKAPTTTSTQLADLLNKVSGEVKDAAANPDPRFTAAGFFDRLRASPLSLFNFSDYQIKPGSQITANGFGFTATGNDVHVGDFVMSNLSSDDSTTIQFTMTPSIPEGTYEAWITNSSGSSRKPTMPIKVIITNNPAPRPIITSVSPAVPGFNDTVTLNGANLGGAIELFTSFGMLKKFSSTPTSITFSLADFDIIGKIKDQPTIKGQKISVSVTVATPQGYNKDMFTFGVQF
jgi:hypothetical protein